MSLSRSERGYLAVLFAWTYRNAGHQFINAGINSTKWIIWLKVFNQFMNLLIEFRIWIEMAALLYLLQNESSNSLRIQSLFHLVGYSLHSWNWIKLHSNFNLSSVCFIPANCCLLDWFITFINCFFCFAHGCIN